MSYPFQAADLKLGDIIIDYGSYFMIVSLEADSGKYRLRLLNVADLKERRITIGDYIYLDDLYRDGESVSGVCAWFKR